MTRPGQSEGRLPLQGGGMVAGRIYGYSGPVREAWGRRGGWFGSCRRKALT